MKKLIAGAVAVAVLATLFVTSEPIQGQQQQQPAQTGGSPTHKIGLIDMAEVFKEYEKFKVQRDALQAEIQRSEATAQAMLQEMQKLQEQVQEFTPDSPEYKQLEKDMINKKGELEAYRASQQRDFLRKESELYKQVYLETQDIVEKYAKWYKYTLILRFNRSDVANAANPQEVIQSMNRQVVYYADEDDITDPILMKLNELYAKQTASSR